MEPLSAALETDVLTTRPTRREERGRKAEARRRKESGLLKPIYPDSKMAGL